MEATIPYRRYTQPKIMPPAVACANLPSLQESPKATWANPNKTPTKTIKKIAFFESSIPNEEGDHRHFRK